MTVKLSITTSINTNLSNLYCISCLDDDDYFQRSYLSTTSFAILSPTKRIPAEITPLKSSLCFDQKPVPYFEGFTINILA